MINLFENSAWLYDYDNRDNLTADIPFYLEYAKKKNGDILELGCGTGRVVIPLAKAGFNVTGLDLSDAMLTVCKSKIYEFDTEIKSRINLVHGNMAKFKLDKEFSLITAPFRAFQALTVEEDIKGSLACIRNHLDDSGIFIVNAFRPYEKMTQAWCYPETVQWQKIDNETNIKIVKKHWGDKIDTDNQIIYAHYAYEITYSNGSFKRIEDDLKLKYYYYEQLKKYLIDAGFHIIEEFGWYDKSDIKNGRELIFVCKKTY